MYGIKKNGTQIWKEDIDGAVWGKPLVGEDNSVYVAAITSKYPSRTTRAAVEAGDVWLFEAEPRN